MDPHIARWAVAFASFFVVHASPVLAQAGSLDISFDPGSGFNSAPIDMVVQPDGRPVVVGGFNSFNGTGRNGIARLTTSGALDSSFDPGSGAISAQVRGVALQSDGRIVAGGAFTVFNGAAHLYLVRLEATGMVDATYTAQVDHFVHKVAVQPDDKVLAVGLFTEANGVPRNRIARFNTDGTLDTTFDPGTGFNNAVHCITLQADGAILVGGDFTEFNGTARSRIARLNADGSLDTSFDPGSGFNNRVHDIAARADGSIVVAGAFTMCMGSSRQGIARLGSSGTLDMSYYTPQGFQAATYATTVDAQGNAIVGGVFTQYSGLAAPRIARLTGAMATLDGSFDPGTGANGEIVCMDRSGSEHLFVIGGFTFFDGVARAGIARLNACMNIPWYNDADGDGLGDNGSVVMACAAPPGHVADNSDCDDTDDSIGAPTTWYMDADGDEFGDPTAPVVACVQPAGAVEEGTDCDDSDPDIVQGAACDDSDPYTTVDQLEGYPDCGCHGRQIVIQATAMLQGAYDPANGLMRDDLRALGLVPLMEPYTTLGYAPVMDEPYPSVAGGDLTTPGVLAVTGPDAIVDWVILELRSGFSSAAVRVNTRYALIQRDGDIVEPDGVSPVRFPVSPGFWRLALLHRNHMGIVQDDQNGTYYEITSRDMTDPAGVYHGVNPRYAFGNVMALRVGDTSFNDDVAYVGFGNDRDPVLVRVGGSPPTATYAGYFTEDTNMDGVVKYVGAGNDRDPILTTVGGSTPTTVRMNVYLYSTY